MICVGIDTFVMDKPNGNESCNYKCIYMLFRYFVEIPPIWETDPSLVNVHRIAVDQSVAQYTGGLVKVSVLCTLLCRICNTHGEVCGWSVVQKYVGHTLTTAPALQCAPHYTCSTHYAVPGSTCDV